MNRIWMIFISLMISASSFAKELNIRLVPYSSLKSKYHFQEKGGISSRVGEDSEPVLIITTSRGWVVKLNRQGQILWRHKSSCTPITEPELDENQIFYACKEGELLALGQNTGKESWKIKFYDSIAGSPRTNDQLVIFQTGNGAIFALDKKTGTIKWVTRENSRYTLSLIGASQPLIIAEKVYVGLSDGTLTVFNIHNRDLIWKKRLFDRPVISDLDFNLMADDDQIYASSREGICAISKTTEKIFWCLNEQLITNPAMDQNFIYALNADNQFIFIDKSVGTIEGKFELNLKKPEKFENEQFVGIFPVDQEKIIFVLSNYHLWKIDPSTNSIQLFKKFRKKIVKAQTMNQNLFLLSSNGKLIIIELLK